MQYLEIEPGTFWEHFYVIARLGEGGMAEVMLAYDLETARLVALKFILGIHATNPKVVARMRREGEIYRQLKHPSILDVLDIRSAKLAPCYLVLDYLRGEPLDEVLEAAGGPLEVPRVMRLLDDLGSALNLAHKNEIIHRDVKPQNVMMGPDGRATLYDFGIARAQDDLINTQTGSIMGTLAYAAPEQRAVKLTDHRTDIFALGAILYEALTAKRVIEPGTYKEMVMARSEFLPNPSELNPKVPPVLDEIVRKMIEDDPEDRYADLKSLLIKIGLMRLELSPKERRALFGSKAEQRLDEVVRAFRYDEIKKAEGLIEEMAAKPPPSIGAEIFHLRAAIQVELGEPGKGVTSLEKALGYEPTNLEILLDLALLLLRMGKIDKVEELFAGIPSWIRGSFLVRALMDMIKNLPRIPGKTLGRLSNQGPARKFHAAVAALEPERPLAPA